MDIKDYILDNLRKEATEDSSFNDKFTNNEKTIEKCIEYIKSAVRMQYKTINGCVAVADDDVLKMARHYYNESKEDLDKELGIKEKKSKEKVDDAECDEEDTDSEPVRPVVKNNAPAKVISKAEKKAADVGQMSMFDLLGV